MTGDFSEKGFTSARTVRMNVADRFGKIKKIALPQKDDQRRTKLFLKTIFTESVCLSPLKRDF